MDMGPNREENLKDSFVRSPRLSGETQFTTSTLDVNGYVGGSSKHSISRSVEKLWLRAVQCKTIV